MTLFLAAEEVSGVVSWLVHFTRHAFVDRPVVHLLNMTVAAINRWSEPFVLPTSHFLIVQ